MFLPIHLGNFRICIHPKPELIQVCDTNFAIAHADN
jgi:hypothetical protein